MQFLFMFIAYMLTSKEIHKAEKSYLVLQDPIVKSCVNTGHSLHIEFTALLILQYYATAWYKTILESSLSYVRFLQLDSPL